MRAAWRVCDNFYQRESMISISSSTLATIYIGSWYFRSVSGDLGPDLVVQVPRLDFQYMIRLIVFSLRRGRCFWHVVCVRAAQSGRSFTTLSGCVVVRACLLSIWLAYALSSILLPG